MDYLTYLKGMVIEPVPTFRTAIEKRPFAFAAFLAVLPSLLRALMLAISVASGKAPLDEAVGLAAMDLVLLVVTFAAAFVLCHFAAGLMAQGSGRLGDAFLVVAMSQVVAAIGSLIPIRGGLMPTVLWGWQVVLVVLGLREAYGLTTTRAAISGAVAKLAASVLGQYLTLFALPLASQPPFATATTNPIQTEAQGDNLLINGGFEDQAESSDSKSSPMANPGATAGWSPGGQMRLPGHKWERDTATFKAGAASGLVAKVGLAAASYNCWWQKVGGLSSGDTLQLSAWAKTDDATAAAFVITFLKDKPAKPVSALNTARLSGTTDWAKVCATVTVPDEVDSVVVSAGIWGKGKLWVDDVALVKTGSSATKASPEPPPTDTTVEKPQPPEPANAP